MAYEKNHIYQKDDKKKLVAFNAESFTEEDKLDETNEMTLITYGVR